MWVITATGECSAETVQELHKALKVLLSDPEYGTTASQFSGPGVNGPAHGIPAEMPKARGKAAST